jgi:hypothetical protein
MAINIPTTSIAGPSKIYPNWYFWFENKQSGNPVAQVSKVKINNFFHTPSNACHSEPIGSKALVTQGGSKCLNKKTLNFSPWRFCAPFFLSSPKKTRKKLVFAKNLNKLLKKKSGVYIVWKSAHCYMYRSKSHGVGAVNGDCRILWCKL